MRKLTVESSWFCILITRAFWRLPGQSCSRGVEAEPDDSHMQLGWGCLGQGWDSGTAPNPSKTPRPLQTPPPPTPADIRYQKTRHLDRQSWEVLAVGPLPRAEWASRPIYRTASGPDKTCEESRRTGLPFSGRWNSLPSGSTISKESPKSLREKFTLSSPLMGLRGWAYMGSKPVTSAPERPLLVQIQASPSSWPQSRP